MLVHEEASVSGSYRGRSRTGANPVREGEGRQVRDAGLSVPVLCRLAPDIEEMKGGTT